MPDIPSLTCTKCGSDIRFSLKRDCLEVVTYRIRLESLRDGTIVPIYRELDSEDVSGTASDAYNRWYCGDCDTQVTWGQQDWIESL